MSKPLSELLAKRQLNGEMVTFEATEDWAQGRTMFGGFLSAMALVAMRDTQSIDMPLRTLQTNFVGPVPPGPVVFRTRLLRQGKSVSQVQCEIYSDDTLAGMVVGVFGQPRQSQLPPIVPTCLPVSVSPEQAQPWPPELGVGPNFTQHVEMRWAEGQVPFSGGQSTDSSIYLRLKDQSLSPEVLVVMLSDAPPTPLLGCFNAPTMSSSVSWSLELSPMPATRPLEGWFRIDMVTEALVDGYANQSARLWSPDGTLASLGYQVVAVYG